MGEWAVAKNDGALRTLLGSCIGLALYDQTYKVAGLAHVVLPWSPGGEVVPGKFVDTAAQALVSEMTRLVGRPIAPTARIAGGANMFRTEVVRTIGLQNIEASERVLAGMGIPIVGRHCGGEQGRRMTLDTSSGLITIEIVGKEPIELRDTPRRGRALS
jgi:chemotaxis protein CheD